jgi:hypothetical protein
MVLHRPFELARLTGQVEYQDFNLFHRNTRLLDSPETILEGQSIFLSCGGNLWKDIFHVAISAESRTRTPAGGQFR